MFLKMDLIKKKKQWALGISRIESIYQQPHNKLCGLWQVPVPLQASVNGSF